MHVPSRQGAGPAARSTLQRLGSRTKLPLGTCRASQKSGLAGATSRPAKSHGGVHWFSHFKAMRFWRHAFQFRNSFPLVGVFRPAKDLYRSLRPGSVIPAPPEMGGVRLMPIGLSSARRQASTAATAGHGPRERSRCLSSNSGWARTRNDWDWLSPARQPRSSTACHARPCRCHTCCYPGRRFDREYSC